MGPAVKAPKLRSEATQLCCSLVSLRHSSWSWSHTPWVSRSSWGRVGADHDNTVPSPNEPIVANRVARSCVLFEALAGCLSIFIVITSVFINPQHVDVSPPHLNSTLRLLYVVVCLHKVFSRGSKVLFSCLGSFLEGNCCQE